MYGFLKTRDLTHQLKALKLNGCTVSLDKPAGTVEVKDGPVTVLRALQKGPGGAWIARYFSSDRIAWE